MYFLHCKNKKLIYEIIEQLKLINDLRKNIFNDRDKVKEQEKSFYRKVRQLNNRTRKLKEFIRDRCDKKGRDWYERLEKRKKGKIALL